MLTAETMDRLHDADIIAIRFESGVFAVSGKDDVGKSWEITVAGVRYMVCGPFLPGNIIGTIIVHRFQPGIRNVLRVSNNTSDMFFDTYGVSDSNLRFSEFNFLEISSSYGVEILCLFNGDINCKSPL